VEIYNELKNGSMRPMAEGLSDTEVGAVAAYLAPSPAGAGPSALRTTAPSVQLPDPPKCAGPDRFAIGTKD
jgi:cytochrome c553